MQQSPEGTESECASDPIDRPPSVSSPIQVSIPLFTLKPTCLHTHKRPYLIDVLSFMIFRLYDHLFFHQRANYNFFEKLTDSEILIF